MFCHSSGQNYNFVTEQLRTLYIYLLSGSKITFVTLIKYIYVLNLWTMISLSSVFHLTQPCKFIAPI